MTWKQLICIALKNLGGEATLGEIYEYVERHADFPLSKSWKATTRSVLERSSSDSAAFDGKNDLFYSVYGIGNGVWGLRQFETTEDNMDMT